MFGYDPNVREPCPAQGRFECVRTVVQPVESELVNHFSDATRARPPSNSTTSSARALPTTYASFNCRRRFIGTASQAELTQANLQNADLRGANLSGVVWQKIKSIESANVYGVRNAPPGFLSWAMAHRAILIRGDDQ
jgi:hypothetical protein